MMKQSKNLRIESRILFWIVLFIIGSHSISIAQCKCEIYLSNSHHGMKNYKIGDNLEVIYKDSSGTDRYKPAISFRYTVIRDSTLILMGKAEGFHIKKTISDKVQDGDIVTYYEIIVDGGCLSKYATFSFIVPYDQGRRLSDCDSR